MNISRDTLLRIYWIVSLCALAFAFGLAVGVFKVFPYRLLQSLAYAGRELARYPGTRCDSSRRSISPSRRRMAREFRSMPLAPRLRG